MFQFRAFPSYGYGIHRTIPRYCLGVFPHSEISGSSLSCSSPKLFAACHVLRRLLMPRHSPCALISLTCKWFSPFLVLFQNYAGSTDLHKIVFTLIKSFHNAVFLTRFPPRPLLPCFLFPLCSVFKVQTRIQNIPSKLNNARDSKAVLGLLIALGVALRAPQ